jgi:hypothetical protein
MPQYCQTCGKKIRLSTLDVNCDDCGWRERERISSKSGKFDVWRKENKKNTDNSLFCVRCNSILDDCICKWPDIKPYGSNTNLRTWKLQEVDPLKLKERKENRLLDTHAFDECVEDYDEEDD